MKIIVEEIEDNAVTILRRAGYTFQREDKGEMSFVRVLARAGYPRFHVYTRVTGKTLFISFHLDQKRQTYGEGTRHHGEYGDDGALKEESGRLLKFLGPKSRII